MSEKATQRVATIARVRFMWFPGPWNFRNTLVDLRWNMRVVTKQGVGCLDTNRLREKLAHGDSDLFEVRFQREVPRIQKLHRRIRNIPPEGFRPWRNEIRIVLAPYRQQRRL